MVKCIRESSSITIPQRVIIPFKFGYHRWIRAMFSESGTSSARIRVPRLTRRLLIGLERSVVIHLCSTAPYHARWVLKRCISKVCGASTPNMEVWKSTERNKHVVDVRKLKGYPKTASLRSIGDSTKFMPRDSRQRFISKLYADLSSRYCLWNISWSPTAEFTVQSRSVRKCWSYSPIREILASSSRKFRIRIVILQASY